MRAVATHDICERAPPAKVLLNKQSNSDSHISILFGNKGGLRHVGVPPCLSAPQLLAFCSSS